MKRVGVLALQGAFIEHIAMLQKLGVQAWPVRLPSDLEGAEGLIIPGGESTVMSKLMVEYHLLEPLERLARGGLPIFGTCAGMILLAKDAIGLDLPSIGIMNIEVRRNAFGRQLDSFETELSVPALGDKPFPAIFIRAPWIEQVGPEVKVLACLPDGRAVAARQENLLVSAFHPELTDDLRLHAYFLGLAEREARMAQEVRQGTPN